MNTGIVYNKELYHICLFVVEIWLIQTAEDQIGQFNSGISYKFANSRHTSKVLGSRETIECNTRLLSAQTYFKVLHNFELKRSC